MEDIRLIPQRSSVLNSHQEEADFNAEVQERKQSAGEEGARKRSAPAKRSQYSKNSMVYTPVGGEEVELWIENNELKSSRNLNEEEKHMFGEIKSEKEHGGMRYLLPRCEGFPVVI